MASSRSEGSASGVGRSRAGQAGEAVRSRVTRGGTVNELPTPQELDRRDRDKSRPRRAPGPPPVPGQAPADPAAPADVAVLPPPTDPAPVRRRRRPWP